MDTDIELTASHLACIRQDRILFSGISFTLTAGTLLLIEGPNGIGKSSLLRLIAGLATPAQGEVYWGGKKIHASPDYADAMHYLAHTNGLKLGLTVTENWRLMQAISRNKLSISFEDILFRLDLSPYCDTAVGDLSSGQKRKISLARLFLFPKSLWILDEPLTSLDADAQHLLQTTIASHAANGGIVMMTSHQPLWSMNNVKVQTLRLTPC